MWKALVQGKYKHPVNYKLFNKWVVCYSVVKTMFSNREFLLKLKALPQ